MQLFGFQIGKKISETIFLVDISRQSKCPNYIFPKKNVSSKIFLTWRGFLPERNPTLGDQRKFFDFFFLEILILEILILDILIVLKNQPEKWSPLLLYLLGTQKIAEVIQTGLTMIKLFSGLICRLLMHNENSRTFIYYLFLDHSFLCFLNSTL